ncbi:MAG: hypothetical protein AAGA29_10225 [Planctomycetota bacterium]
MIYQMNVVPERRRGLVAASLLRAMFERSAYGVKLYCCWCAQDLAANRFWEAMGFVPLAFRTGSRKKSWKGEDGARHKGPRIHIFWQKRIRQGDHETPWWFPSQTGSGAMREDRIVLPIPPGTHWSDAKPAVLPGVDSVFGEIADQRAEADRIAGAEQKRLPQSKEERQQRRAAKQAAREEAAARSESVAAGGLHFGPRADSEGAAGSEGKDETKRQQKEARKRAQAEVSKKNDPRLVAMARELRDRWLEYVAAQPGMVGGGVGGGGRIGKYDISRRIEGCSVHEEGARAVEVVETVGVKRLDAA